MNLNDAITAVEQSQQAFASAAAQTSQDQQSAAAIQAKLDQANAQVQSDAQAQDSAAGFYNATLDALIQAATAAKIPVVTPAP